MSYRPLARVFLSAGALEAAPGDGISSDWLIAELTHRQAHGLKLQYRSRPRADTHVPLGLGALAPWGGGTTHEVLASPPKDQSWGPDSIVLRVGLGVSLPIGGRAERTRTI